MIRLLSLMFLLLGIVLYVTLIVQFQRRLAGYLPSNGWRELAAGFVVLFLRTLFGAYWYLFGAGPKARPWFGLIWTFMLFTALLTMCDGARRIALDFARLGNALQKRIREQLNGLKD